MLYGNGDIENILFLVWGSRKCHFGMGVSDMPILIKGLEKCHCLYGLVSIFFSVWGGGGNWQLSSPSPCSNGIALGCLGDLDDFYMRHVWYLKNVCKWR